jgi:O-antigen/teichoic acid export membrane protein
MNRAEAEGDVAKVLSLNSRSNVACALFVFPVLAFLFAAASPFIRLIYTDGYAGTIPVLRLNVVAFLIPIVEMSTVMLVLRQGPFFLRMNSIVLVVGLLASYAGSQLGGMPGAAAGVIAGNLLGIFVSYARAARLLALPVRALQDWRTIARIGAAAIIAGVAAYVTLLLLPPTLGHALAILISGAVFCCAYLPSLVGLGQWGLLADVLALPPDLLRHLAKRFKGSARRPE